MLQSRSERGYITCGKRQDSLVIAGHAAVVKYLSWTQKITELSSLVIPGNCARESCFSHVVP